ncbi:hypothetical protein BT96DRAFT_947119 [Gymnopus androsaceus JB14]|uniref:Myb/SANT-like domain-containing protein n=1 Tax=Gymnopus androsaceus JB14 TaxID=1447944 RepID=A0A6A4GVG9_9AGAR|nr:hypothetical protein BT96DRAFT_947119 [Gymnopus androsaceus JB14]
MTRNTAQAAESANSTVHNDKENNSPHPPAPSPKKSPSKPKKPAKSKAKANDSTQSKPPPKRVIFSAEDDNVMVETLLEQKEEGFATDNGGWKDAAFTAVVKALEGSELVSGGLSKSNKSVRDHWNTLKKKYEIFNDLASISGWGWDSVNQRVQASDEQWDNYLKNMQSTEMLRFRYTKDLAELLNGALATGKSAFHAGSKNQTNNADSDLDLGRDPIDLSDGDDDEGSGNEGDISAEISSQILATPGPSKRKISSASPQEGESEAVSFG